MELRPCPKCNAMHGIDYNTEAFRCACGARLVPEHEDIGEERCSWFEVSEVDKTEPEKEASSS